MNTAPAARSVRMPSLYEAVAALERHFGAGFVHAPRWGTADGAIEYRQLYGYAALMRQQRAEERLHLARARALGANERAARDDEQVAHGLA